jgi:hypothetical protein
MTAMTEYQRLGREARLWPCPGRIENDIQARVLHDQVALRQRKASDICAPPFPVENSRPYRPFVLVRLPYPTLAF